MAKKASPEGGDGKESTAGYFRKVFEEKPQWLNERSNKKLLKRWLADHPGQTEVPTSVKANLANLKSVLRSKRRSKVARRGRNSSRLVSKRWPRFRPGTRNWSCSNTRSTNA